MDGDTVYWDGKREGGVGESRALFDHDKSEVARRHLSGDAKQWCVWSSGGENWARDKNLRVVSV